MKEIFQSLWSIVIVISAAGCLVVAQSPAPTPQDKRGLGIESGAATRTQTDQSKSKEAKPELVLQTGYNNFFGATRLFSLMDGSWQPHFAANVVNNFPCNRQCWCDIRIIY